MNHTTKRFCRIARVHRTFFHKKCNFEPFVNGRWTHFNTNCWQKKCIYSWLAGASDEANLHYFRFFLMSLPWCMLLAWLLTLAVFTLRWQSQWNATQPFANPSKPEPSVPTEEQEDWSFFWRSSLSFTTYQGDFKFNSGTWRYREKYLAEYLFNGNTF